MLIPAIPVRLQRGFTLIETMITIVIVAVALSMGVPAFSSWMQNTQIRTVAESIQNGLQVARNEALRRNCQVQFSLNNNTSWTVTAIVPGGPNVQVQARAAAEASSSSVSAIVVKPLGGGLIATFDSFGRLVDANPIEQINVQSSAAGTKALGIQLKTGGQIRMCDPVISITTDPRYCQL
jgi:type IV fimbrial biogenesis protein FimT